MNITLKYINKLYNINNIINDSYSNLTLLNDFKLIQSDFYKNGFVKVKLLDENQCLDLLNFYKNSPNSKNDKFGFHVSLDLEHAELINTISNKIINIIKPSVDNIISDYQFISPRFAVKEANQNSLVPPHQDWSFVDENKYQSYNLWIALTPSTIQNGTLGFLKGSHQKLSNIRATPLPYFKVPFHDYAYELLDEMEYIELEAGEALLFNSRIIHASKPNSTNDARINIAVELTHKDAPLIHYNLQSDNHTIYEYEIDNSFFTKYSNLKLTDLYFRKELIKDYKFIRKFKYNFEKISKAYLLK